MAKNGFLPMFPVLNFPKAGSTENR
jgi:hypothetical protein